MKNLGYRTIDVATAEDALRRLDEADDVAPLLTDVVLRGSENGADLAREVTRRRPEIAVLYASGYTETAIIHHGRLDRAVDLLEKPFTQKQLAERVAQALERGRAPRTDTRVE